MKPRTKKMWVAMNSNTSVYIYRKKPKLDKQMGMWGDDSDDEYMNVNRNIIKTVFPKLTFENSPQRVNVSFELITK